ncbi:MAG: tetratricopeptide repeat protein, partial [bacterium]
RLGLAYQQTGDLDSAEEKLRKAQNLAPSDPGMNYYLGNLLFLRKKMEEAIKFLNKSLQRAPEKAPVRAITLSTLAAAYDEMGEYEKSLEYYQKALQIDPDNATILNNYSYSLSERGERLEEALEMVNKALEVEPENGAFLDTIGWVYYKLGDYKKALEYIKKSIAVRDESAEVLEHLGDIYEKLGQMDLAIQFWKKAMELEPDRKSLLLKLNSN